MNQKTLTLLVSETENSVTSSDGIFKKAVLVEENGKCYAVNPNAIFTINCTSKCNAKCFFCYNYSTFMRDQPFVSVDDEKFLRAIRFARKSKITRAALSGGEPTLQPQKLLMLVEKLSENNFLTIKLHTNGFLLNTTVCYRDKTAALWEHLLEAGITHISISLADHRADVNRKIMMIDTAERVSSLLPKLCSKSANVRLSCYLCQEGINNYPLLKEYISYGLKYGVKDYIFRLSRDGALGGNVVLKQFAENMQSDGWRIFYSHEKSDSLIFELEKDDIKVSLSCASEEIDKDKKIRRLIYMPDRVLYTSWIDPTSFLFDDDAKQIVGAAIGDTVSFTGDYPAARWALNLPKYIKKNSNHSIDLHVHSLVSDGLYAPTEVIRRSAKAGLKKIVFTEHNCMHDSFAALQKTAEKYEVEIPLCAVEFSTVYCVDGKPKLKFHMLVYGEEQKQFEFMNELYNPNKTQNDHIVKLYNVAHQNGVVSTSLEEIYKIDDCEAPTQKKLFTRTPLAAAIAQKCGCTIDEAKEHWLSPTPDSEKYAQFIDCTHLLHLAHAHGCAVVLAHPGWVRQYNKSEVADEYDMFEAIAMLAREGLDGVEIVHRLNDSEMRSKLCKIAISLGLIIVGGSDYHGKPRCFLGTNGTEEENLKLLQERIRNLKSVK